MSKASDERLQRIEAALARIEQRLNQSHVIPCQPSYPMPAPTIIYTGPCTCGTTRPCPVHPFPLSHKITC